MVIRNLVFCFFVCFIVVFFSCRNNSDGDIIPIQDFFSKSERTNFKVSPDGKSIAYLGLEDHCRNIFILNIDHPESSKQLTYQKDMNVQYFFWVTPDSIVYSNSQSTTDSLRLFVIDINSEKSNYILKPAKHALRWVSPTVVKNGSLLAQMNVRDSSIFDLYRIPLNGEGAELVENNSGHINSWYASADGKVRLALSSDSVEDKLWFRTEEHQDYKQIIETDFASTFIPLGPVQGSDSTIFALSNLNRDKMAVVKFNLFSGKQEIFAENEKADMNRDGYLFSRGEMILTRNFINQKETSILNKDLKVIYNKISKQFEGYNIEIVDLDKDFNITIFKAYTDVNPGGYYYYSKKRDRIEELSITNQALAKRALSPMKEISFNARDGKLIHGYLTLPLTEQKRYPIVVLVHDGPNRRDAWGFNQDVQFLANRGYGVLQINYRGSIGYGKSFYVAGFKQWGGEIQNDINDGVSWLIHEGVADKNRIAIMGSGFGGYSALYAACFNPTLYKCAISSSGFTNLFTYLKEIPPYYQQYLNLYYKIIGDPSKESELFKAISPLFHAEKVNMPLLMFNGGQDRYNSITDVNQFVQKVKNNNTPVQYIYKEDEGRRFKKEEHVIEYYQQIELFLKEYLK